MAGSMNKVFLMGNLTRDIELRAVGDTQVGNIGLAVNRRFRTAAGEDREETTFVDCETWGKQAEIMARYLQKGRPVLIEGRLKLDQWQDQQGNNRSKLKVVVENFTFVDSRGDSGGGGGYQPDVQTRSSSSQPAHQPMSEDDIPF
jgi:single-strand DNA-binding protein